MPEAPQPYRTAIRDGVLVVTLHGDYARETPPNTFDRIRHDLEAHGGPVAIDLAGVTAINSTSISNLVALHGALEAKRIPVRAVHSPNPLVRKIILATGIAKLLPFDDTVEAAVRHANGNRTTVGSG